MAEKTAEKKIYYVRKRPAAHPLSQHQLDLVQASKECGIAKGMSRKDLVEKMRTCVPDKYKEVKERRENVKEGD